MFSLFIFFIHFSRGSADPICPYVRTPMDTACCLLQVSRDMACFVRVRATVCVHNGEPCKYGSTDRETGLLGWTAYWRHLANTSERSVRGGDAALCLITSITCCSISTLFAYSFSGDGVLMCSIDNMPAQLPRESTEYFGSLLMPHVIDIVSRPPIHAPRVSRQNTVLQLQFPTRYRPGGGETIIPPR